MSPYITSLFDKVSEAEAIASALKKDTTTLDDVINKFKTDLGQKVAPRILFPIVKDMITMTTEDKTNTVFFFKFVCFYSRFSLSLFISNLQTKYGSHLAGV